MFHFLFIFFTHFFIECVDCAFVPICLAAVCCIAIEWTRHLVRQVCNALSTVYVISVLFPATFSTYSIAFIACDYDPLNTFIELIVKASKVSL